MKSLVVTELERGMSLRKKLFVIFAVFVTGALTASAAAPAQAAQGSSLNGRVTDAQGAVVSNVEVSLAPVPKLMPGMTMAPPAPIAGRVNADGTFVFNQVAPGEYVLQADAPGFQRASQP